jgi:hypothetical protein
LGVERVGVDDNFFDLGGHSLKTNQIRWRLGRDFGIAVPLRLVFERATVADQAEALAELLRTESAGAGGPVIPRLADEPHYKLSPAQHGLWFLHQIDPLNSYYNVVGRFLLEGPLQPQAFQEALHALVARHESLRTTFGVVDEEPVQRIAGRARLDMPLHDLSALGETERSRRVGVLVAQAKAAPFQLDSPPVRAALVKLGEDRHLFVLAAHHLLLDGASLELALIDLLALYSRARHGGPSLPPLPVRYVDYAAWHHDRVHGEALQAEEAYWCGRLGGDRPRLRLPLGRCSTAADAIPEVRVEALETTPELTGCLQRTAADRGATLFMVALAALKAFLCRVTGQADILVGSPVTGRVRQETERMIGLFVNLLVFRTDLSGDITFETVLERVKQTSLEALARQEYPFSLLVRRLNPSRSLGELPLVQVAFESGRAAVQVREGDLRVSATANTVGTGESWRGYGEAGLAVLCLEQPDGRLTWKFEYDPRRLRRESVQRLKQQFSKFLLQVVAHV